MENTIKQEFITHEKGNEEAWVCICGNKPIYQGFYPCDEKGKRMEPEGNWKGIYICNRCGRIIHQHTLEVVGQKIKSKQLPSDPIAYTDMEEKYNLKHGS
jgi:hypothetical protein